MSQIKFTFLFLFMILAHLNSHIINVHAQTKRTTRNPSTIKDRIQQIMIEGHHMIHINRLFNTNTADQRTKDDCIDPSPEERSKYLLEMYFIFRDVIGILDLAPIRAIYSPLILNETLDSELPLQSDERTDCVDDLKVYRSSDFKLCPSHQVLRLRKNVYPAIRAEVKCNCDKCLQLSEIKDDVIYTCQPVRRLEVALVRGECSNGIYKWNPALEYVNAACICAQSNARIEV